MCCNTITALVVDGGELCPHSEAVAMNTHCSVVVVRRPAQPSRKARAFVKEYRKANGQE